MRRLPGILLATGASIIVVVALLISGLRLALPKLNDYRPQLVAKLQSYTGIPLQLGQIDGRWETFGPTLEMRDVQAKLPEHDIKIERITLALDVWQSLLHFRWQFRDLTFYQLQWDINGTFPSGDQDKQQSLTPNTFTDIVLRQLDHFDLRDSRITFLTPSGPRAEFDIPQLTWLNSRDRHRAEGQISLSSLNGQHGVVQVRMDLQDQKGLLDTGTLYLQADNIDMKPWFSRWLQLNTGLDSADFSLAAWLSLKEGEIYGGNALLKQGSARWQEGNKTHQLAVDNLALSLSRQGNGWQFAIPRLDLSTDGQVWPHGDITALWLPENNQFMGADQAAELRVRAHHLQLERFTPLLPLFSFLSPEVLSYWRDLKPEGNIDALALDIPLQQPEKTRFLARWSNLSWQPWERVPGVDNFAGVLSGSVQHGRLNLGLQQSTLPYSAMFRAPLAVSRGRGAIEWQADDSGWQLSGHQLDIQAQALWANGDFRYQHPKEGQPWLDILSGIRLTDAAQAWRYFPEPLMGKHVADYLTGALQGGQVDNASLIFTGNPQDFPFTHNEGQFEVFVPLRNATYQFDPEWPALPDLAIDLDFRNNGLWMAAPLAKLGDAQGHNVTAVIPDYEQEKLLIDADVSGEGYDIGQYFLDTPLADSLGAALEELQLDKNVSGRLHLDIPLDGKLTTASGEVTLNNNGLLIKPLDAKFEQLSGKFRFNNGTLDSDNLTANWFGQPVALNFKTQEGEKAYQVNVGLNANWAIAKLPLMPDSLGKTLTGNASWQSKVAVTIPHQGSASYQVGIDADLSKVSSHLPAPLDKKAGAALPLQINVQGGLKDFTLSGSLGKTNHFNSRWLLSSHKSALDRASWQTDSNKTPPLPADSSLAFDLPALDGEKWLALLEPLLQPAGGKGKGDSLFGLPSKAVVSTPELLLAGQAWKQLRVTSEHQLDGDLTVTAKGSEIDASLDMASNGPWRVDIKHLYYNPQFTQVTGDGPAAKVADTISFRDWPALILRCESCWVLGQNLGRVNANLTPKGDTLELTQGLVDTGRGRISASGHWQQDAKGNRTALKGFFSGNGVDETASYFGFTSPLKGAPYQIDYDLYWQGAPWQPKINTLNGIIKSHLGKGEIDSMGGGRAGQLLRLLSFDALLRKLQFDFRDTFGQGFYFDSINGNAWLKDGILHTDNLLVDGLAADIAMSGQVDLVQQKINMEAVITPEVSATVGVATAFAINPVIGAVVFAATKALGPLWNKISLIRYQVTGDLDDPKINEVLRQKAEAKAH